jgi:predicted phosphoribosyltransferase
VICAAPVGSAEAQQRLDPQCDEVVLAHRPDDFTSIAEWYDDFPQLEDFEVQRILAAYS